LNLIIAQSVRCATVQYRV